MGLISNILNNLINQLDANNKLSTGTVSTRKIPFQEVLPKPRSSIPSTVDILDTFTQTIDDFIGVSRGVSAAGASSSEIAQEVTQFLKEIDFENLEFQFEGPNTIVSPFGIVRTSKPLPHGYPGSKPLPLGKAVRGSDVIRSTIIGVFDPLTVEGAGFSKLGSAYHQPATPGTDFHKRLVDFYRSQGISISNPDEVSSFIFATPQSIRTSIASTVVSPFGVVQGPKVSSLPKAVGLFGHEIGHALSDLSGAQIGDLSGAQIGKNKAEIAVGKSGVDLIDELVRAGGEPIDVGHPVVKGLTKSIGNMLIQHGLEEARAESVGLKMVSMIPNLTESAIADAAEPSVYVSYRGFHSSSTYGGRIVNNLQELDNRAGLITREVPIHLTGYEKLAHNYWDNITTDIVSVSSPIKAMVNLASVDAAAAYNRSLLSSLSDSTMLGPAFEAYENVLDTDLYLDPTRTFGRNASALGGLPGLTQIPFRTGLSKSLDKATQTGVSIKAAVSQASKVVKSESRPIETVRPIEKVKRRVAVMGRKTLDMLIQAGETAAKVMR